MFNFREMTKKLSTIPPDFVPYMEKHKLYEFFYELATQLLIQQPEDPIVFMKQCVQHSIQKRDIPRVILIAPPSFDKMAFANVLQAEIGLRPVTLGDLQALSLPKDTCRCIGADDIAISMKKMLKSGILHESGWILVDVPRTKKEACALQRIGVIPTHVMHIILSNEEENSRQQEYKRNLRGLHEAYANVLIEVEAGSRTIQELGKDCAVLTKIRKHYGAPSLFRIVLIGPRGSGCHSLGKYVSDRFNLVYVDFNYLIAQAHLQGILSGSEILQMFKHECSQRKLKPETLKQIVEKYVLGSECLKRGWIITGYPITAEDCKFLDTISTPPNRVIILKVNGQTCRKRLLNRRYNIVTGSEHNFISSNSRTIDPDYELDIHPKDHEDIIQQDIERYEKNIEFIMRYVGETACVIDATDEWKVVRERLETCLIRPAPFAKPRVPYSPPAIDPMDIEHEPDDEPDLRVFDNIRASEPKFSFI